MMKRNPQATSETKPNQSAKIKEKVQGKKKEKKHGWRGIGTKVPVSLTALDIFPLPHGILLVVLPIKNLVWFPTVHLTW